MSVLEPIEKEDLNLKEKFIGKQEGGSFKEGSIKELGEKKLESGEKKDLTEKKEETYSKILSQVTSYKPASTENLEEDIKMVDAEKEAEAKITKLVEVAKEKGVIYAVKVARKVEDNYILDELHDRLANEFHAALIKEGLIKEI